ncbi:hypothetical protein DPMN_099435 [Dreissena polymorpha]|uniref:Proteasome activator complex subunit 4-like HEAT repeat-like domain-containing protein n=1 Tax=Dreissena polymorpha TaxID=45954 RepID=A0A9D4LEV7_DREPO|nr:hypothetical protein DPMN_099435 [Dreissena polymorpha]
MSDSERVIYDAFSSPEYVAKLIDFLTLEENKGKDQFNHKRMILFKVCCIAQTLCDIAET